MHGILIIWLFMLSTVRNVQINPWSHSYVRSKCSHYNIGRVFTLAGCINGVDCTLGSPKVIWEAECKMSKTRMQRYHMKGFC